jgi:hypothetical protein
MKMGTIATPWRYEVAAARRGPAGQPSTDCDLGFMGGCLPDFEDGPVAFGCGHFDQSWERRDRPNAEERANLARDALKNGLETASSRSVSQQPRRTDKSDRGSAL